MYSQNKPNINFITITNSEEAFIDILDSFPSDLEDLSVDIEVTDIFPTSLSITLEGDKYDILEAMGKLPSYLFLTIYLTFILPFIQ